MSSFDDIIKKGTAAAKVELPEPEPSMDAIGTMEKESSDHKRSVKKPGRPKKGAQKDKPQPALLVSYVTNTVKQTLKRIQAAQTLSSSHASTESEIISAGLDLYIKHNKLNIN